MKPRNRNTLGGWVSALLPATVLAFAPFSPLPADGLTAKPMIAVGNYHSVGLGSDGTVVAVGRNSSSHLNVGAWTEIIQIDAGGAHTVGLRSDGKVVGVGDNDGGQLNVGRMDRVRR